MAERCTVLCESNMRALLKDLCVSLPPVYLKIESQLRDVSHIYWGWALALEYLVGSRFGRK